MQWTQVPSCGRQGLQHTQGRQCLASPALRPRYRHSQSPNWAALRVPTAAPQHFCSASPQRRSHIQPCAASTSEPSSKTDFRERKPEDVRVLVVGPTGYIGRFVVKELIKRGFNVAAFARPKSGIGGKSSQQDVEKAFKGAEVLFGSVSEEASLKAAFAKPVDVVVSCLASRTGGKKDSWAIDYQATSNVLKAAQGAGASHFVLLSAICVQKPLLEFQHAKLKFEEELQQAEGITHSIVRPTAFFKSVAGQVDLVKTGKPFVMFGDGRLASCKPISEADLAAFMADCVMHKDKLNQVLPIGGPGKAWTALEQGEYLFQLAKRKPSFIKVPVGLLDGIIGILDFVGRVVPQWEDAAELGRIGRYYAVESMLVWDAEAKQYVADATPSYGKESLEQFFRRAVLDKDGMAGQDLGDAGLGF